MKKKKLNFKIKLNLRKLALWLLVIFFGLSFLGSLARPVAPEKEEIPLSQAIADVRAEKVKRIEVEDSQIALIYQDDQTVLTRKEEGISLSEILKEAEIEPESVEVVVKDTSLSQAWIDIIGILLPLGLTALFFFLILRQARGAQDSIFSFGRSRAKIFSKGKQSVSFKDVAGVKEAKEELEEVVDFLKHPAKYRRLGARTPKGVLLIGPSGVGKTLLARAVAGEANVPFFSVAGSEFMEMLVGVGSARMRDLFSVAKKAAPSIIFVDEIETIGRHRGLGGFAGGHGEQEQTLNQMLTEMDGFTPNDRVIVLAATNRPDLLDPALTRPGRFDRRIALDMPDIEDREGIIKIHARGKPLVKGISWEKIAKRTVGFSGADIENMLNEAAILAARQNKKAINMDDIEEAATKVKLGPEKKKLQEAEEKKMTAYHEAGHAVVSFFLPHMDPVHRISIVSRGMALGFTLIPPKKERQTETRSHLLETITSLLGGRAAEEIIFNELTAGAASDIDQSTRIARRMVVDFGMSQLGPVHLGPQVDTAEYGRTWIQPTEVSPEMQAKIDSEIKRIVDQSYQQAANLLKKNRKKLDLIAQKLLDKETIDGEEFSRLMGKKKNEKASSD